MLAAAALAAVRALWLLAAWLFAQQGAGRLHLWWRAALEHRVELSAVRASSWVFMTRSSMGRLLFFARWFGGTV